MARVARYTEQVSSMVDEPMKQEINRLAEVYRVSQGEVIRLAMENKGLTSVEKVLKARTDRAARMISAVAPAE